MKHFASIAFCTGLFFLLCGISLVISVSLDKEYDDNTIRALSIAIGAILNGIILLLFAEIRYCCDFDESDQDLCKMAIITSLPICCLSIGIGLVIAGALFSQQLTDGTKMANILLGSIIIFFSIAIPCFIIIKYQRKENSIYIPDDPEIITD